MKAEMWRRRCEDSVSAEHVAEPTGPVSETYVSTTLRVSKGDVSER